MRQKLSGTAGFRGTGRARTHTTRRLAIARALERLECRQMLAGTHDQAILDAITQALLPATSGGFSSFTNRLKDNAVLGKVLPLVNRGIGDNVVPKAAFDTVLSRLGGSYGSVAALANALEGSGGIGDGLQVVGQRDLADNIEYDLRLVRTTPVSVPLSSVFGSTDFAASGSLSMNVTFDFRLTVGGQWSGSSAFFYVADSNDTLSVSAEISATNVNAAARLGFVDVSLSNASATLRPTFAINLTDPSSSGGTGRVNLSELNGSSIATMLPTTLSAAAPTSFAATLSTSGAVDIGPQTLSFGWSDINSLDSVSTNLSTLGRFDLLSKISKTTLGAGLAKLVSFIDASDEFSSFGRPLPIIGTQWADVLDLPGFLNQRLVTSIGTYNTIETLANRLAAQSGFSGVSFNLSGETLTYTFNLNVSRNQGMPFELSLNDLPLRLEGAPITISAQANGTLKFGIDLTSRDFFLSDNGSGPELSASASVNATNVNASGGVGFASAQVSNGQAQLSVNGTLDLDRDGSDRFTTDDLSDGALVAGSARFAWGGSASATLPISSPLLGLAAQTFSFGWSNLSDPGTFNSNIANFASFNSFKNLDRFDVAGGINALLDLISALGNRGGGPLDKELPIVGKSFRELVDFATLLQPLAASAGIGGTPEAPTTPFKNSDQLLTQLRNIAGVGAGNANYALVGENLEYTVHLDRTINRTTPIALGVDTDVLDLSVSGNANVALDVDLDLKFGLTPAGKFYFITSPTPTFAVSAAVTLSLAAAARLGFIDVTVAGATASFGGNASIRLIDPGTSNPPTPGKLQHDEFDLGNLGAMAVVTLGGSASATLPLTTSIPGVAGGNLVLNWSNVGNLDSLSVNSSGVSLMSNFDNVDPDDVLSGLNVIPSVLALLKGSGAFGKSIGIVGGNLGNIADLAARFTTGLTNLQNAGSFKTAQQLATRLGSALTSATGGAVNVATSINGGDVRFTFSFAESLNNKQIPIGFSKTLGPASFNFSATPTMSGSAGAQLTVGVRLAAGLAPEDRFYIAPGAASGATIAARINLTNITAAATLGYFALGITNGTANVAGTTGGVLDPAKNASLSLQLVDPNSDGRISLGELTNSPGAVIGPVTADIAANLNLPITSGLPSGQGQQPRVTLVWNNLLSGAPTITTPDLNNLLGADTFNFTSIGQGITSVLGLISSLANNSLLQTKIPLIDVKLADVFNYVQDASQFWNAINVHQSNPTAFATAVANADAASAAVTIVPSSDPNLHNPAQSKFHYTLDYSKLFPVANVPFKFGGGLFTLAGSVQTSLNLSQHIVWGMNPIDGFFIKEGASINANATLAAVFDRIGGKFGFLNYGVKNGGGNVNFNVGVLAQDADVDDFIKLDQLKSNLFGLLNFNLAGTGRLHLPIGAHLGNGGPGVKTDFRAYWDASKPTSFFFSPVDRGATPITSLSTDPTDGFAPIHFEVGEWVSSMVGPFFRKIGEFNPLSPEIIDFLNTELPIIGKTPIEMLASQIGDEAADAIQMLLDIADVVNSVSAFVNSGKALDLSGYFPAGGGGTGTGDALPPGAGSADGGIGLIGGLADFLRTLRDEYSVQLLALDPDNIGSSMTSAAIKLFMGEDVDLVRWNPEPFEASYPINTPEFLIAAIAVGPIVGTISGQIKASVGLFADPDFGFSSRGLRDLDGDGTPNFLDGFFIGDNITNLGANQTDPFEVGGFAEVGLVIKGRVTLLGLLGGGIEGGGGIRGTIGLDLSDVKYSTAPTPMMVDIVERREVGGDNRIYFDELEYMVANFPMTCVLHMGGTLSAYVEFGVFVSIFGFDVDVFHTRQDFELFNFDIPCEDPPSGNVGTVSGTTWIFDASNSKYDYSLRVDPIYNDQQRLSGFRMSRDRKAGNYERIVERLYNADSSPNLVDIYANAIAVGTYVRLQSDNKIYKVAGDFFTPVHYAVAPDRTAPDTIKIDASHDYEDFTLLDPSSANYIGNVTTLLINGTLGGDTVRLNPNVTSTIAAIAAGGGPGELRIRNIIFNGFSGADVFDLTEVDATTSNLLNVTLDGGDGNDTMRGGFRGDLIIGGGGNDSIEGGAGNDTLRGNDGKDYIVAGAGDDLIEGGLGDDVLLGTSGRNTLRGEGGNDSIVGGINDDSLDGGDGNDSIAGGSGFDTVSGGAANDLIDGGDDNDALAGDAGNDTIMGGAQDDFIDGGTGNDSLTGDEGFDVVRQATTGDVTVTNAIVTSGAGADSINASVERVVIVGSAAAERFNVTGWTRGALSIDAAGGIDTLASDGVDFVLDNGSLTRDGVGFALTNVEAVDLVGINPRANSFDVGDYARAATITGNGLVDSLVVRGSGSMTLAAANLTRSIGTSLNLNGIERARLVGGADGNLINASGYGGAVTITGNGGNDSLVGGVGDDSIDGGAGDDIITGNGGDDLLIGGGGLTTIDGGDGDDVIRGSDDARDSITAGAGRDYVFGNAGNDVIDGGAGDDSLLGGAGDDSISGQAGRDLIAGGSGHDVAHGHNATNAGDDNAVDHLYGDFANNLSASDAPATDIGAPGRDCLYGGGGNDVLSGEGDDDFISAGGGGSNRIDYGSGESGTPSDFVIPTATPAPTLGSVPVAYDGPTLPIGPVTTQRWGELSGSAGTFGVTGGVGVSTDVSVASGAAGTFLAWSDNRSGNYEIYVARHDGTSWVTLGATSASGTGVSNSPTTDSRRPAISLDAGGNPVVAWTEVTAGGKKISVARWNGASWTSLGTSISSAGNADGARIVHRGTTPIVAFINEDGTDQANVVQYNGSSWVAFGTGAATHSVAADAAEVALATDGTNVAVAYRLNGDIFVRESNGGAWATAGGGAVAITAGTSVTPTLAYSAGALFAAWADGSSGRSEIYAARFSGGAWQSAGAGSFSGNGVSATLGSATAPQLVASGANVTLAWLDDQAAARRGSFVGVFARRWDGAAFVEQAQGDAQRRGIHGKYTDPTGLALAMKPDGSAVIAWSDRADGREEIKLRVNTTPAPGTRYYVNDNVTIADVFSVNPGSDTSPGTSPDAPISTVAKLFATGPIAAGSVIYLDAGVYDGFTISTPGVRIIGAPGGATRIKGSLVINAANVTVEQVDADLVTFNGSATGGGLFGSVVRDGLVVSGSGVQVAHNQLRGPVSVGNTSGVLIASNERTAIAGASGITLAGATGVVVRDNVIRGGTTGIAISTASGGVIEANDVGHGNLALDVGAAFSGSIRGNRFHDGSTGVRYAAAADLSSNLIYANTTGISSTVGAQSSSLGFVGTSEANFIFRNTVGVTLSGGWIRRQNIFANTTGVSGSGTLGGTLASDVNTIEFNTTGASFTGTVQFNRIGLNDVGLAPGAGSLIHHNVFYRNATAGISASGAARLKIASNTVYARTGDAVRLAGNSSDAELRNNILWTDGAGGYALNVADNASRTGFFSDYNSLIAGAGAAGIVHFSKPFTDLIDWQRDLNRYDLHSVGTTVVDPFRATPRFASLGTNDLQLTAPVGGRRFSNAAVDAADVLADFGVDRAASNLLQNPGFEGNLSGWTSSLNATTGSTAPTPYSGTRYYSAGNIQIGFVEQTVPISASGLSNAQVDASDYVLLAGGRFRSLSETALDSGKLIIRFLDGSSNVIGTGVVNPQRVDDRWHLDGGRFQIPSGTRSITYRFESTRVSGATSDAFLDDAFMRIEAETAAYDQGAFGQNAADTVEPAAARLYVRYPDMYQDLEVAKPHTVRWESFGNASERPVKIDLYRDGPDGPAFALTLTGSTPDDGEFVFTPGDFGITFGDTGLRVLISFVGDGFTNDISIEGSTVPTAGSTYYVDDASNANDQYTAAAVGDNRNTGKLASAPKPLLTTLLRVYDLGAGDVVNVDTGSYGHFENVVISGNVEIGDDEGALYTGPTGATRTASLFHYYPTAGTLFEFNDGDFTTVRHFTLQGANRGLWARNDSTSLTVSDVTVTGTALEGIRFEADAIDAVLQRTSVTNAGSYGLYSGVRLAEVSNGTFSDNGNIGLYLVQGATLIEANTVQNNTGGGIYVGTSPAGAMIRGNLITGNTGNSSWGMYVSTGGTTTVTLNRISSNLHGIYIGAADATLSGNAVSNHTGANSIGISIVANADVVGNVLANNTVGIDTNFGSGMTVRENRITGSTNAGIRSSSGVGVAISRNVLSGNRYGMDLSWHSTGGTVSNNIIYGSTLAGIHFSNTVAASVTNNTIYETSADGIRIDTSSRNVALRNNIIWTMLGGGIVVASDSQTGFASDYNLLYATAGGWIGTWQGVARTSLAGWRSATFGDQNSLNANPLFIDADGANNTLGDADDDFHLSTPYGYNANGWLAPVLNPLTGLPIAAPGTFTTNPALPSSPGIDRGDPSSAYANEPPANGSIINLGAHGNTTQAERSPGAYVLVISPNGSEGWSANQAFDIRWNSHNFSGTVDVILVRDSQPGFQLILADDTANDGLFTWTIPTSITPGIDYRIRVVRNDAPISDTSDTPFEITGPINIYYVNDNSTAGDVFTSAVGNDANTGTSPNAPKATLQALLAAYDLGPGDIVRVDTGRYGLTGNIAIGALDAGVTIEGPSGFLDAAQEQAAAVAADSPISNKPLAGAGGSTGAFAGSANQSSSYDGATTTASAGGSIPGGTTNSVELWFNPTASNQTQYLLSSAYTDTNGTPATNDDVQRRLFSVYRSGSQVYVEAQLRRFNSTSNRYDLTSFLLNGAIRAGEWNHIVLTFDGSSPNAAKLYVNGSLQTQSGAVPTGYGEMGPGSNASNFRELLGADALPVAAPTGHFSGRMQALSTYGTALQPNRVRAHFDAGFGGQLRAVLDRQNTSAGSYVFELQNADGVTLKNLQLQGAYEGVFAGTTSDSDNVTLQGLSVYGNANAGVHVDQTNEFFTIAGSEFGGVLGGGNSSDDQRYHIYSVASDTLISDNRLRSGATSYGVYVTGARTAVKLNQISGVEGYGVYGAFSNTNAYADAIVISQNDIANSGSYGIAASYNVRIEGNVVHDGRSTQPGITVSALRHDVLGNTVYRHSTGISATQPNGFAAVRGNRVYGNTVAGISSAGIDVIGNTAFSNGIGLSVGNWGTVGPRVANNLVYASGTIGLQMLGNAQLVENNTFRESGITALVVGPGAPSVTLRNNVFSVSGNGRAISVNADSQTGFASNYNLFHLTGGSGVALWQGVSYVELDNWDFELGFDAASRIADPQFVDPDGADNLLGYVGGIDRSGDDDFRFAGTSPVIDAGDPVSFHHAEPAPSGGRVNLGHLGNTAQANVSANPLMQVLQPNGREKLTVGVPYDVRFRAAGFTTNRHVLLANFNGPRIGMFESGFAVDANPTNLGGTTISTSGVTDAAPAELYRTVIYPVDTSPSGGITIPINVPDGTYTLRLHFADNAGINSRKFDIRVNGTLVQANYDITAAAGGTYRAVVLSIPATATGGTGVTLQLLNKTSYAIISGLEVLAPNPGGAADPRFNLDVSYNNGLSWGPLATNVAVDRFGNGSASWSPTAAGSQALVRVSAVSGGAAPDVSDVPFLVAPTGNGYYVNDAATTGDVYTTAVGNNANSGKSPASPMASIASLLARYDLGPGDVIYVDAGDYNLLSNLVIDADDAGVEIRGAGGSTSLANNAATAVLGDAPTGYWRLAESGGSTAASQTGGGTGTALGGVSFGQAGAFAGSPLKSAGFDGVDDRIALNDPSLNITGPALTLGAWINPNNANTTAYIIGRQIDGTAANSQYSLYISGGYLGFRLRTGVGTNNEATSFARLIAPNTWTHVAMTYDGVNVRLFVNGESTATYNVTGGIVSQATPTYIGQGFEGAAANNRFAGRIQDVVISAAAISPARVSEHYLSGARSRGTTLLNRGNASATTNYGIELRNADGTKISGLTITGASYGIFADSTSDTDGLILDNLIVVANRYAGVSLAGTNDDATITNSSFIGLPSGSDLTDQDYGIVLANLGSVTIRGNTIANSDSYGISGGNLVGGLIEDNTVTSTGSYGILLQNSNLTVRGNEVSGGNTYGIYATGAVTIDGNLVHDNTTGIYGDSQTTITRNTVYNHTTGIYSRFATLVADNRVYRNTTGIYNVGEVTTVRGNRVYSNATGLWMDIWSAAGGDVTNNIFYANTDRAVRLTGSTGLRFTNNTIYQPTGHGLLIDGTGGLDLKIRSNLFVLGAGRAIEVAPEAQRGVSSDYNLFHLTGTATIARWQGVDFTSASPWFYRVGMDGNSLFTDAQFGDIDGPDDQLGFVGGADRGADDTFTLLASSPTTDAGDPFGYYLREPGGGGGRVNIGHGGNSAAALLGAPRAAQILSPNGRNKFEAGASQRVDFTTRGIVDHQVVAQLRMAGPDLGYFLADRFRVGPASLTGTYTAAVDTSGIVDPPSQAFYARAAIHFGTTPGQWIFPVADGAYSITLHFNEPDFNAAGSRKFDIKLNGTTVRADLDTFAQAGGRNRAFTLTFNVAASGGDGIDLQLVNKVGQALLYGVEIFRTGAGAAAKTVNLGLSTNAGGTYSPLGGSLSLDRFGRGSYNWTVGNTPTDDALFRVTPAEPGAAADTSDDTFQIVASGANYYVNDGSLSGDTFTTAIGNDANDGKSAARPMATLRALLAAYDLDAGDTVFVDAGTYVLMQNILVQLEDAGVRIVGAGPTKTILDRGNASTDRYSFEFTGGADGVSIESMSMTGGYGGVYSGTPASDNVTLKDVRIFANQAYGVRLDSSHIAGTDSNDNWLIRDSVFFGVPGGGTSDNQTYGVYSSYGSLTVRDSTLFDHATNAIYSSSTRSTVRHNTVYGNTTGIAITGLGNGTSRSLVVDNDVYSNATYGIQFGAYVDITGNRVRNHTGSGRIGITGSGTFVSITGNVVYNNFQGLSTANVDRIAGNRIYFNADAGIVHNSGNGLIEGNQIYSNSVGIRSSNFPVFAGRIQSNLIYANADRGIEITNSSNQQTPIVANNTIYQPVGDAVYIAAAPGVQLRNNILYVGTGYAIRLDVASQTNFSSNRNVVQQGNDPNASVGFWGGARRDSLADWQGASGQDAQSLASDPKFVDIDGADNVLGYSSVGGGVDGGRDDNFYLLKNSPAIDRADAYSAANVDFEAKPRFDDPGTPNVGTVDYYEQVQPGSSFGLVGAAQNFRSNNTWFNLNLPFTFSYFGVAYTQARVTTEGYLQLGTGAMDFTTPVTSDMLKGGPRIAVLWDQISTTGAGDDIFVQSTVANQITIRWNATREADGSDVNASVTLFSDGSIRFDYGNGNANMTPVIGLGTGGGDAYVLGSRSGTSTLANVVSSVFSTGPGTRDLGAFEFRGSSTDVVPPRITSTLPATIHTNGSSGAFGQIGLTFSEPINRIDAQALAAYRLIGAGADDLFGTVDDVTYALTPHYVDGSTQATLSIDAGSLPVGRYQLTVIGNAFTSTGLHDLSGLLFDGDADGVEGGNYVRTFTIVADTTPPTVTGFAFDYAKPQHTVRITFSEMVGDSLSLADIQLKNLTTNTFVDPAHMLVSYDPATNTLTISFPGLPNQRLAKGRYELTINGSTVSDAALNPMASNYVKQFLFSPGDATGDGLVTFDDLLVLAQNYGLSPRTYVEGDFTHDGKVNFDDLLVLAQNYGGTLDIAALLANPEAYVASLQPKKAPPVPRKRTAASLVLDTTPTGDTASRRDV